MTDIHRARNRAEDAPPEEQRADSDSPVRQSREILEDSDARQEERDAAPGTVVEHRRSEETVDPPSPC